MDSDNDSNDFDDDDVSPNNALNQNQDNEVTEEERSSIRSKLSTLSFEDLQKLKNKLGSKVYNKTVYGDVGAAASASTANGGDFKRANKNRPREMSSKIRPKRHAKAITTLVNSNKKLPMRRDPRFDPLCGAFDSRTFKSNYKFVNGLRKNERDQLQKEYQEQNDPKRKEQIKYLMQRMDNQIREQDRLEKDKQQDYEEKRQIKEQMKRGEAPVFKKKSVKRLEKLIGQYEDLKKSNKLQKHIEKRSKKLSTKDRINMEKQNLI